MNILVFATVLIVLGMFIDFLIYVNSAPVPLPYEREHFMKSSVKATLRWIGWLIVFWLLTATISAAGSYVGLPFFSEIADSAGIAMISTVIVYDLRKLRYTRFYYFKPVKSLIDLICNKLDCEEPKNHSGCR